MCENEWVSMHVSLSVCVYVCVSLSVCVCTYTVDVCKFTRLCSHVCPAACGIFVRRQLGTVLTGN